MAVPIYDNLTDPARDLNIFLRTKWGALPEPVQTEVAKWDGPGVNTQDRAAAIVECMWANRTKPGVKTVAAREIMAGVALYYGELGLLFFRDGRGERMANALRRDMGDSTITQAPEDDPEPLPQYVPEPVEPPAEPPPGT